MLGNKLKNLRLTNQLTLEELASSLNKTYPGTVNFNKGKLSKWENDKEEPKLSSIRILADFYELTIDDLYHLDSGDFHILSVYNQLNETNKKLIYDFALKKLKEQSLSSNP